MVAWTRGRAHLLSQCEGGGRRLHVHGLAQPALADPAWKQRKGNLWGRQRSLARPAQAHHARQQQRRKGEVGVLCLCSQAHVLWQTAPPSLTSSAQIKIRGPTHQPAGPSIQPSPAQSDFSPSQPSLVELSLALPSPKASTGCDDCAAKTGPADSAQVCSVCAPLLAGEFCGATRSNDTGAVLARTRTGARYPPPLSPSPPSSLFPLSLAQPQVTSTHTHLHAPLPGDTCATV